MLNKLLICYLCAFIYTTKSWILEVNQNTVTPQLSTNVTIDCHHENADVSSSIFTDIYRIRVSKFNDKNGWETVAAIKVTNKIVQTKFTDITATGNVNKVVDSYLEIRFDTATEQSIGQFMCEVDGFDNFGNVKVVKSKPVVIQEKNISFAEILKAIKKLKSQVNNNPGNGENSETAVQILNDKFDATTKDINIITTTLNQLKQDFKKSETDRKQKESALSSSISNLSDELKRITSEVSNLQTQAIRQRSMDSTISATITNLTQEFDDIKNGVNTLKTDSSSSQIKEFGNKFSSKLATLTKTVDNIQNDFKSLSDFSRKTQIFDETDIAYSWPSGQYSLPKPDTGCPNTITSRFEFSSIRISTRTESKNSPQSNVLNLAGDVFQSVDDRRYVNMELCSMELVGNGPEWPKGSYCFQTYSATGGLDDSKCPSGFHLGHVELGRVDDGRLDVLTNLPGYASYNSYSNTMVFYCCRDDGPASTPTVFPKKHPFFLYRFGGECQTVVGMNVTRQYLHLDTVKELDKYWTEYHPDGSLTDGLTIELCYYKTLS